MTDKDLVRLHTNRPVLTKAEFNQILLKAKIYKAIGAIIIFTVIVLLMAIVGKYLN